MKKENNKEDYHASEWTVTIEHRIPDFNLLYAKASMTFNETEWKSLMLEEIMLKTMREGQQRVLKPSIDGKEEKKQ